VFELAVNIQELTLLLHSRGRGAKYCDEHVCLSVSLSVRLRLKDDMSKLDIMR